MTHRPTASDIHRSGRGNDSYETAVDNYYDRDADERSGLRGDDEAGEDSYWADEQSDADRAALASRDSGGEIDHTDCEFCDEGINQYLRTRGYNDDRIVLVAS